MGASKIARDITARKQAEQTAYFLAGASAALADLTDYESTLQKVASLAVPPFADWCAVDMVDTDGSVRRLVVIHSDPEKVRFVQELDRRYPTSASDPGGVGRALRTGQPDWAPVIPEEMLAGPAKDEDYLRCIRQLGLKSYICVPLKSRGNVLGVLTFVTAESSRTYGTDDLRTAEDLAHRAVIAIENASLLAALQDTDRRKNEFLAMLAHELRNPLAPIRNAVQIFRANKALTPEMKWATDVVARQAEQMTRLVDDLLDISRGSQMGKIELRCEQVELAAAPSKAPRRSQPSADRRPESTELLVEIPAEPIHSGRRSGSILADLVESAEQCGQIHGKVEAVSPAGRPGGRAMTIVDSRERRRHWHSRRNAAA